jgi:signal transduction histidine kinase
MPATDVARTGEPVFIEEPDEYVARYREPLEARGLTVEPRSVAVVPLEVEGRQFGAVGFTWNGRHDLPADRRAFVAAIARLGATAMDRARLFDAERRHAAELEAVVAAIGEAILVAEPDGTIRSSNAAAARLLGEPRRSVEAFLGSLLDADADPPSRLPTSPTEFRLAGHPTSWVEVTSYPVAGTGDDGSIARVIVCRDVSAFRQGQALREAFLGLLSHELRTPVTTIYGGASVLARASATLADETRAEILADVANESDRLSRLVEDLLVLARFDEGLQLGDEPALLQHLVPAVVGQERGRWPLVDFAVEVAPDLPAVRGDETSINQVLRNLISNAAKYGDASAVTVVVDVVSDGVAVRVRDAGPGINPQEAEDIFYPFYRSASTAKMAGGAGIGLYVSRRLVEAMQGRIWALPRPEGGSEFSFVLPRYVGDGEEEDVEEEAADVAVRPGTPIAGRPRA